MKYVFYLPNLFTGCHSTKNYKGIGKKHKKIKASLKPEFYLYIVTNYSCKLPASNWQVTVAKPNFDQVVVRMNQQPLRRPCN